MSHRSPAIYPSPHGNCTFARPCNGRRRISTCRTPSAHARLLGNGALPRLHHTGSQSALAAREGGHLAPWKVLGKVPGKVLGSMAMAHENAGHAVPLEMLGIRQLLEQDFQWIPGVEAAPSDGVTNPCDSSLCFDDVGFGKHICVYKRSQNM